MIKKCAICSGEYEAVGRNSMYCRACGQKRKKERDLQKGARLSAIKSERKPIPKPKASIAEQARRAKEAGMTYGQYVAKYG